MSNKTIKMRYLFAVSLAAFALVSFSGNAGGAVLPETGFNLSNDNISVTIGADGSLQELTNVKTGQNYASGGLLWRLYYDCAAEKEIQVEATDQKPSITSKGNGIVIRYDKLNVRGETINMAAEFTVTLEADKVRFASKLTNNEPHTVIRELHYPLVHGAQLPSDHKLFTSEAGGKLYSDPYKALNKLASSPYKKPEQFFRQRDVKYGAKVFMNCFGLFGADQGLYLGSHDATFQDTWQGMRAYKSAPGKFDCLEFGFFKYPHTFCGESWECDANVIAPYSGNWKTASRIYRAWVNTWWEYTPAPKWVREDLPSWQRVIFKHQYGEYFFKYPDLYGKVDEAGTAAGVNSVFLFGWWAEGMDHGNPDYSPDETQGGDAALAEAIAKYQQKGNHLILYYNGKLIDRESRFYRSGSGPEVCRHDNTGSEILERYKFTGKGTWLGEYDQRTFAVATMMDPKWNQVLFDLQDRAYGLGAQAVFFDQLGYIENESTNWDTSREFPVPDTYGIIKRAQCLKLLRDRYAQKAPDFALGAEGTVDALAQYCDFTHGYPANDGKERWLNFFRYTFPELVFTDRGQRDDEGVEHHVNYTLLDGQRNDVEIYRCRDIISDTPHYQAYLGKANAIKKAYASCLMGGVYKDDEGFTSSCSAVDARAFLSQDGHQMVILAANQYSEKALRTKLSVPGYKFADCKTLGDAKVKGTTVTLGLGGLAALRFELENPVRIGSYNLRMQQLDKGEYAWEVRRPRLMKSIRENGFDIFGIQELTDFVQPQLREDLGDKYEFVFFSPYRQDGVGNKAQGIAYDKERFELVESHFFWMADDPSVMTENDWMMSKGKPHPFKRGGICATFLDRKSGRKLFFMNNHGILNKELNEKYAHVFVDIEKKYNPKNLPSFFVGDFNARYEHPSHKVYREYWKDCTDLLPERPATFNGFNSNPLEWNKAVYIDYIYYRNIGTPVKYTVNQTLYDVLCASDHFPIWADFSF